MNYKPYRLTLFRPHFAVFAAISALTLLAVVRTAIAADEPAAQATTAAAATSSAGAQDPETTQNPSAATESQAPADEAGSGPPGAELLDQVQEKLKTVSSLKCDIHQTSIFTGMKFIAAGHYVQATGNRFRLEYTVFPMTSVKATDADAARLDAQQPAAEETAAGKDGVKADAKTENRGTLTQVSDGNVLFTHMVNGATNRVTRRNVSDILKASEEAAGYSRDRAIQDLGLGGLGALIARIQSLMDLTPVSTVTVSETKFLVVSGRWNSDVRKRMFQLPDGAEMIPQEFIPEYVRLYIDAATLLPRRIQYLKRFPDPAQKQVRPIVTIDLRQIVVNDSIDESLFVFKTPEGVQEEDITEGTIQTIRQGNQTQPATAPGASSVPATGSPAPASPPSPPAAPQP